MFQTSTLALYPIRVFNQSGSTREGAGRAVGVDLCAVRVLALTHQYPTPFQPTYSTYNRQQFAELAELHELRVIRTIPWTLALTQRRQGRWQGPGPLMQGRVPVMFPVFYYPPKVGSHTYGPFFEWSARRVFAREVKAFTPDVVLATWAHPDGWAAVRLARRASLPIVLKVTGADVLVYATGRRRQPVVEALTGADAVVVVSEDLERHVRELGVPASRVHVVSEGVDRALFSPGDRASARERLGIHDAGRLMVFAGSLLKTKGAFDLVDACAVLRERGVVFTCRLVGGGADAEGVAERIRQRGLGELVVCAGSRPHEEMPDWYRASDLVVLPTYVEGLPNTLREAVACGRPFVATRVGGIPEIANSAFSQLVEAGNVAQLADALQQMLAAPPIVDSPVTETISGSWRDSASHLAAVLQSAVTSRTRG